jgi:hypothetical protein
MSRSIILVLAALVLPMCCLLQTAILAQGQSIDRPVDGPATNRSRELIVCIDGVGFSTIEKMRAEGHFQNFKQPSRMISPFPTLTNVSLTEVLEPAGASKTAGYEDNYFDVSGNKMRGGIMDRFNQKRFVRGTFRELFDYHPSALKSGLGYIAPPFSTYLEALTDLTTLKGKFRKANSPVFFAYIGSTDTLAHVGGERMVRSYVTRLEKVLQDIIWKSKVQVNVTVFSDHGNHFRKYARVSLKSALTNAGMRLESQIRDDRSVVLPQFGLVGCAVLFTKEENEPRLADIASGVRGVDFAAYATDNIVHIVAANGAATIERRGDRFRYNRIKGDPLGLAGAEKILRTSGKADSDTFTADSDWFEATKEAQRPDALRRIYEALNDQIRNPANVLLNFEDGYYTGNYFLDVVAILHATHGNLFQDQSFGFVMSTNHQPPGFVRAKDLWPSLGSPKLASSMNVSLESSVK